MKEIIETLYTMNRNLVSKGFDDALDWIDQLIGLEIKSIPTGTKFGTWTVPKEWVIRDGWVKYNGKKIVDYKKNPLSIGCYSNPIHKTMSSKTFNKHVVTDKENPTDTPYDYRFYDDEWSVCMPYDDTLKLGKGKYEVFIDSEFKDGELKYGIHTIPGETEKEILLFAHLDHPYQANDNLSAVACLVDMVKKVKSKYTVKLVFCAETIGSIAYANTEDLSNVEFMIAIDICGNDNDTLLQFAFDYDHRLNRAAKCAIQSQNKPFRLGKFRNVIGSDEYVFNDPNLNIPGLMITTHPYPEYHTSADKPEIINYDKIKEVQSLVLKIIDIYERDFVPVRTSVGPLMRSAYKVQAPMKETNLVQDYFWYSIDGKRSVANLCAELDLPFEAVYQLLMELENDKQISRASDSQEGQ